MPTARHVKVGRAVAEEDVKEGHSDQSGDETKEPFESDGNLPQLRSGTTHQRFGMVSRHDFLFENLNQQGHTTTHILGSGKDLSE
jgi:hypothetical protein